MKRTIAAVCASVMIFSSLCGCANSTKSESSEADSAPSESQMTDAEIAASIANAEEAERKAQVEPYTGTYLGEDSTIIWVSTNGYYRLFNLQEDVALGDTYPWSSCDKDKTGICIKKGDCILLKENNITMSNLEDETIDVNFGDENIQFEKIADDELYKSSEYFFELYSEKYGRKDKDGYDPETNIETEFDGFRFNVPSYVKKYEMSDGTGLYFIFEQSINSTNLTVESFYKNNVNTSNFDAVAKNTYNNAVGSQNFKDYEINGLPIYTFKQIVVEDEVEYKKIYALTINPTTNKIFGMTFEQPSTSINLYENDFIKILYSLDKI